VHSSLRSVVLLVAIVLLVLVAPARANPLRSIERLFDKWELFQDVQISGNNTLTLQQHYVEGSESAFEGQRWDTGSLQRRSSLSIKGPIWKEFGFQSDLSFSGYGPSYSRWVVGYVGHDSALYFGDLNISLRQNEFAGVAKSLKGWQLDQNLPGGGLLRAFTSEDKGYTRNETLSGNDTPGPYFLRFTPIIDGSESVKVDEQPQRRGVDYRLDYQTGDLWFDPIGGPIKVIPSTSTISVSYQSSGYFGNAGTLTGARAEMPLADGRINVGLTWLRQDRPEAGQGDTVAYQENVYYGSGTTGPFDTNFRPIIADGAEVIYHGQTQTIAEALKVLVDDVEMAEGVDYDAYRQIGRVIFRLAVPPTSLVRIQYYYELGETALSQDAEVAGLDVNYEASDNLWLKADFATSSAADNSSTALQTAVSYRQPRFDVLATYRDVAPQFSYIDSSGFRRNDKGLKLDIGWQPAKHVRIQSQFSDLDSTQGLSFGYSGYSGGVGFDTGTSPYQAAAGPVQTTPTQDVSTQRSDIQMQLDFPGWPTATLQRQTMSNAGGTQGDSDYQEISLNISHPLTDTLRLQASLSQTDQDYMGNESVDPRGSKMHRRRVSLTYSPSSSLNVITDLGNIKASGFGTETTHSSSDYTRLGVTWSPSDKLSFRLNRTDSESLGRVSSGFYGGFPGGGYGGGGGYDGPIAGAVPTQDDEEEDEVPHYQDSTTSLSATYSPRRDLSLTLSAGQRKYLSGGGSGYLSDSTQDYQNLSVVWQATDEISLTTSLSRDELNFLEEGRGAVDNQSVILGVGYRPAGKPWSTNLQIHRMSGASPSYIKIGSHERYYQTDTSLFDISGQLSYELSDRIRLSARTGLSDFDSGYSAFKKQTADINVSYDLGTTNRASFGYRFIGHRAGEPSSPFRGATGTAIQSQDYNAHTFMFSLQSNFTSGLGGSGFQAPSSTMGTAARGGTFGGYQVGGGRHWQSYSGSSQYSTGGGYPGYDSYNTGPQW